MVLGSSSLLPALAREHGRDERWARRARAKVALSQNSLFTTSVYPTTVIMR